MFTMVDGYKKQDGFVRCFVCVSRGNIFERQFGNNNLKYESIFAYSYIITCYAQHNNVL